MKLTPKLRGDLEMIARRGDKGLLLSQFVTNARMRNRVGKLRNAGLVEWAAVRLREGSTYCDAVRVTEAGRATLASN